VDEAGLADGLVVADRDADRLAEWLAFTLGEFVLAGPVGEVAAVAEGLAPGDNGVGVAEGVDVQAETDAETKMAKMAHPAAVSFALPPYLLASLGALLRRPANGPGPAIGTETRGRPGRCPRRPGAGFRKYRRP
jgi:hypothetical protein